jgi:Ran-binding protein 9/10
VAWCRLHVPAGVTHQLVRQYLLHFGYADTLRAFDSAAGVLPDDEAAPADR